MNRACARPRLKRQSVPRAAQDKMQHHSRWTTRHPAKRTATAGPLPRARTVAQDGIAEGAKEIYKNTDADFGTNTGDVAKAVRETREGG